MADDESTARTAVKTYVPAYQKEAWKSHAEELGMSQSEFVRTMVQAGRRKFTDELDVEPVEPSDGDEPAEATESDLKQAVQESLSNHDALTWDELLDELTDDVERRLEDSLDELQEANVVKYSGRLGGYTLIGS